MPASRMTRSLSATTPFEVLAPFVLRGPVGSPLADDHQALLDDLTSGPVLKVGRQGTVLSLRTVESVGTAMGALERLQPGATDIVVALFDPQPSEALETWQAVVVTSWLTAAMAMAAAPSASAEIDLSAVLRLAASASPAGAVVRERFGTWGGPRIDLGTAIPGLPGGFDIPKQLEGLLVKAEALLRSTCGKVAASAIRQWAATVQDSSPRYTGVITGLDPADACPGEPLTISGLGFGDGARGAVVFTGVGGSTVVVASRDVRSWNDKEIVVVVPGAARRGSVGVVIFPEPTGATIAEAADRAMGELEQCIGPRASARIRATIGKVAAPVLGSPPAQADGANLFVGGVPVIRRFDVSPRGALYPGQTIRLEWTVEGAERIEIATRAVAGSPAHELPAITGRLDARQGTVSVIVPGTRRWVGEYVLRAFNRCTGSNQPVEMVLALEMGLRRGLALGGGGTRGDFQVGALLYLYDVKGFRPDAIASTSVGSVNAIDLVMGDDPNRSAAQRLRESWLVLRVDSDMWADEPWLASVKAATRSMIRSLSIEGLLALPYALGVMGSGFSDLQRALGSSPTALFNIGPIEARIRAQFDPQRARASGIALRLVVVSVDTGEVVHVDETGQVRETVTGRAPLVPATAGPAPAPDPVDGVIASAAMPGIFPARRVGNHNGVDGGVRDVVPVRAAVRNLGCNKVYSIRCSAPPEILPLDPGRAFPSVMARSVLGLTYDEVADDDVAPDGGFGPGVEVTTIQPSFDLHDPMVVDPGLIRIAMDYGWMRAADIVDVAPADRARAMALCDQIVQLRVVNWRLAHLADGTRIEDPHRSFTDFLLRGIRPASPPQTVLVPDPAAVQMVRDNGRILRQLILDRLAIAAPCPPWRSAWFQQWEEINARGGSPLSPDPWASFASRLGTLPAESPPAPV